VTDLDLGEVELQRTSAAGQIAAVLRTRIIRGDLRPGTSLTEAPLARTFNVSRNTVREALAYLCNDGIAKQNPYRGVSVTVMAEEDVRDIFRLRRMLESWAIDVAAELTSEGLGPLVERVNALAVLEVDADWREIVEADLSFHRTLISFLRSPRLDQLFEQMVTELRLCILIADAHDDENVVELANQHRALLERLQDGDSQGCKRLLTQQLNHGEQSLLDHFAELPVVS
jgi:DNA-binding GntR family transcriptional regulator